MAKTALVERTMAMVAGGQSVRAAIAKETKSLFHAVELVKTPEAAESLLSQTDSFLRLAKRRLKGETEIVNHIHRGRFALMALIAAVFPAEQGKRTDKKTSHPTGAKFHRNTLTDYRKVHENIALLDAYYATLNNGDEIKEASLAGFLRHLHDERRIAEAERSDRDRRQQNKRLSRPTVESIKNLYNSPGILVSPDWWRPNDQDWVFDYMGWKLGERLDPGGGIIVFRTMGDTRAALEAMSLIASWDIELWPDLVNVRGMEKSCGCRSETLVIGTKGKPITKDIPRRPENEPRCPRKGIESLVLSWLRPWAKERGTPNLIAEILGSESHDGFQFHPWKPEPVLAASPSLRKVAAHRRRSSLQM